VTIFPEGPVQSPGFLLWRVTLRWQRRVTEALKPLELTHAQFVLLASTWWLCRDGATPNQLAVADQANTNISMTSEVLRKLEDRGLVALRTDPRDRRAKIVTITTAGQDLAQRALAVVEAVDLAFFEPAPNTLTTILRSLADFEPERPKE